MKRNQNWPLGYYFMLNSNEHENHPAHTIKTPTIVGILAFISRINRTTERFKGKTDILFLTILLLESN